MHYRHKCLWGSIGLLVTAVAVTLAVGAWRGRSDPHIDDALHGSTPEGPSWLHDVTAASGVQFTYHNGEEAAQYSILESLGGGVALLDYDGDGLLDIFVTGGGYFDGEAKKELKGFPCKLYKNLGHWKFQDVTQESGLARDWHYTQGAAVADYDRDGWPDLLVTGYGKLVLFHNEPDGKGGRQFVDVTAKLGLSSDTLWSTSAGWADIDGDGWPDLYVCHYLGWSFANDPFCKGLIPGIHREVCGPQSFHPQIHALYHNEKGQGFRNVSAAHGFQAVGGGLGVVLADLNDDGRPDLFVANDGANRLLFLNRGHKLEEKGLAAGVAVDDNGHPNASMGIDTADYDGSGRPALWVTNYQGELHGLFRNRGDELFEYYSRKAGIPLIGIQSVGFGTGFVDFDNDGWEDLVIVNGHVALHPQGGSTLLQRPILLHNVDDQGKRFFKNISPQGGVFFETPARGRGLAHGDLDNDGWPDLVVSHINTPVVLLRNEAAPAATPTHHWLGVKLVGKDHRDVIGSTVIVECDGRKLTRFAKGGGSYLSASDPRILFGLGQSKSAQHITVKWSWGQTQSWTALEAGAYWDLIEGDPQPRRSQAGR